jgi:IS30 family transposase
LAEAAAPTSGPSLSATDATWYCSISPSLQADDVIEILTSTVANLPEELHGTLTWDQGNEMTKHALFTRKTGIPVYFCEPRSPWQRGSNENTNGLLRQYFPKSTTCRSTPPGTSRGSPKP